jgi:hypothetical protein
MCGIMGTLNEGVLAVYQAVGLSMTIHDISERFKIFL